MYYEVYIDILFFVNFSMDYLLLLTVAKVVKCTATHFSILIGAAFGAMSYCMLLFIPGIPGVLKIFFAYGIVSILMVRIGLKITNAKLLMKSTLLLYILSFFLGGILEWIYEAVPYIRRNGMKLLGILLVTVFVFQCIWRYLAYQKVKKANLLYQVELYFKEDMITVSAFMDTGNSLEEPISKKPVSIIQKGMIESYIKQQEENRYYAIPFHSVGKDHGIMEGYAIEKMIIKKEDGDITFRQVILGIGPEQLSAGNSYQMILHPTLLEGEDNI